MKESPIEDFRKHLKNKPRTIKATPRKLTATWTVEEPLDWNLSDDDLDKIEDEIIKELNEHMGSTSWNENDTENK